MQGRPSSSRPSTSARPTTAFDRDHFQYLQQHLQQQQPFEIEEESEEESDDEDVFAFLPPNTADQQQPTPFTSAPVPYPEPTFDPWGRQYPICPPAAPPLPPGISGIPSQTHPLPHPYNKSPISPPSPSTDSHPSTGMTGPDFYRLKRLGTAASSKLGVADNVKEMLKEPEQDGDDTKNEGEKNADEGSRVDTDKETYPSDTSNLERDTSLHRQTLAAISPSKGITEGVVSVLRERGTKNPNAMPYIMYSQQASSHHGRDKTGSASASGVGMSLPLIPSFPLIKPLSQPLKMPDSQALNPRLSNMVPDIRIHSLTLSHYLKHITNTGNSNTTQEREYWDCHKLLVP
jgi:hypothetical protein